MMGTILIDSQVFSLKKKSKSLWSAFISVQDDGLGKIYLYSQAKLTTFNVN